MISGDSPLDRSGWVRHPRDVTDDHRDRRPAGTPTAVGPSPSTVLRMEDDERIFAEGAGFRIVQWRNVFLSHWSAPVSLEGLTASQEGSFDLATRHDKVMVLNVVEYGLQIPAPEVRRKASSVLAATAGHVSAAATVLPGEGFWASAARAAVATITLLSRVGHPHRVFATTSDAARWVHPHVLPDHTPLQHLIRALARLTERGRTA